MTSWMIAGQVVSLSVYAFVWLRGGHPERFGAAVLLFNHLATSLTYKWEIGGYFWAIALHDSVMLLFFGWLSFRSARWWPFVVTAAFALISLVRVVEIIDPNMSQTGMFSAHIGLWFVVDLALLAGIAERGLAGDAAVSPSALERRPPA